MTNRVGHGCRARAQLGRRSCRDIVDGLAVWADSVNRADLVVRIIVNYNSSHDHPAAERCQDALLGHRRLDDLRAALEERQRQDDADA